MSLWDRSRTDWEQPGYTIQAHTNSRPVNWRNVTHIVLHYTAATRTGQPPNYIAQMQRSYVDTRGYSLGYSVVVDKNGTAWEIRGDRNQPAANVNINAQSFAILLLVDGDQPANPAMIGRVRRIVATVRGLTGKNTTISGHRDVGATACPGTGIYNQIVSNTFEPVPDPVGELDMKIVNPPNRVYDSRKQTGMFKAGESRKINVGKAGAVFVNVTVVDPQGWGFLTAWADGPMPDVSNVNYTAGQTIANSAWVPVAADGTISIFSHAACHVLVDVQAVAS